MWDIKGELYTYTLPGTSTNASRAQLYALWSGVSLLPQYADSNPDYLSMGWATSEVMPTESVTSYVTYADYSSNPKKVTSVDIKNNREIWEHGKISLFYNDKYYGSYTTPTQASLSIVLGKKSKSGAVGAVSTELGHTYSVTSGKISPSIQVSWPPVVSISYSSNTTGGVKRVPLKGYFQF